MNTTILLERVLEATIASMSCDALRRYNIGLLLITPPIVYTRQPSVADKRRHRLCRDFPQTNLRSTHDSHCGSIYRDPWRCSFSGS